MEYEKPYKYSDPVRISHWRDRMESYPFDNTTTGAAHYRTFGASDIFYTQKTATRDQLESGATNKTIVRQVARPQVNFVSYPMNDFRLSGFLRVTRLTDVKVIAPLTTSYREVYKAPKPLIHKKDCCKQVPDPLLNRIPKSDFEMIPASPHKFMDDHLVMLSEGRKKINFLRQMRNSTYIFS